MARVPTITENSVQLRPVTQERAQAADMTVVGRTVGAGMQQAGAALVQAGEAQDQINAIYEQARAKKLDNDYQTFERNLLFGDNGFYTKQNSDAIDAQQPTAQAIDQHIASLTSQAKTPREREMLSGVLQRRKQETLNGMASYTVKQKRNFEITQSDARRENATDNYVIYQRSNPERAALEMDTIKTEVASKAAMLGLKDAGIIKAMQTDAVSKAHAGFVEARMVEEPLEAATYLDKHRDEIDPGTQLRLDRQLHPVLVEHDAKGLADIVRGEPGPIADGKGPILSRMQAITAQSESGNRDFTAGGALVTSPKGAQGAMQTMPSTQADPGFGVLAARNNSVAEKNRVGRDYLTAMMARYGNDPARAWAAYNAGPGRVDAAIKEHGSGWLAAMPAETRGYVAKNLKAIGADPRSSQGTASQDLGSQLAAVERIGRERGLTDEVIERGKAEVERRYAMDKRVENEREDQAKDAALESVMALGDNFTSPSQIPNFAKLSPESRLQFSNWAKQNVARIQSAREDAAKPKTDLGKWATLSDAYAADPKAFLQIRPEQVRGFLDDGDFEKYLGWRRDALQHKDPKNSPEWLTNKEILENAKLSLGVAGLATGDSRAAQKDAPRVQQFANSMLDWSQAFKAQNGRLPNSEEIRRQSDRFLIQGTWRGGSGFGFEAPGQKLTVTVPPDVRKRIVAAAPNASEAEIQRVYVNYKGVKW